MVKHRGPLHSIFIITLFTLPFLITYKKTAIPYIIALEQHILGDYIAGGGIQLFWPINQNWYGLRIPFFSNIEIAIEWILFIGCLILMIRSKDLQELLKPHQMSLILLIPLGSIFFPMFIHYPINIPNALMVPHLFFLALFILSIVVGAQKLFHITFDARHK